MLVYQRISKSSRRSNSSGRFSCRILLWRCLSHAGRVLLANPSAWQSIHSFGTAWHVKAIKKETFFQYQRLNHRLECLTKIGTMIDHVISCVLLYLLSLIK